MMNAAKLNAVANHGLALAMKAQLAKLGHRRLRAPPDPLPLAAPVNGPVVVSGYASTCPH
jgi:hypothetical protein